MPTNMRRSARLASRISGNDEKVTHYAMRLPKIELSLEFPELLNFITDVEVVIRPMVLVCCEIFGDRCR
jgi:hypothetical protein